MPLKKLKIDANASAEELILAVEKKDRRFRLFQTLFMVTTFLLLALVISAQQRTIDGINNQITEARAERQKQNAANQDRTETILRRLDCLAVYFSQTSRTNLTIQNIDKCTLNRDGDLQQFFTQENDGDVKVSPNQTGSGSPNLTPSTTPPNSGSGAENPTDDDTVTIEPRPPVNLNLPLVNGKTCALNLICVE